MQIKFLAVVVLVIACFAQAQADANPNGKLQLGVVDQLIDQAKKVIEALEKLISELIENALTIFNQLKDKVKETAEAAIETAKDQIKNVVTNAQKQIQAIIDKAEAIGADITECLVDNQDRFSDLNENFLTSVIECINNEVEKAMDIITESAAIVQDVLDSVQELPGKLQQCGTSLTCITKVMADVAQMQVNLPSLIGEKVAEVTEFVSGLQVRLEVCAATQLVTAGIEAAKIVADVTKCSADKITQQG